MFLYADNCPSKCLQLTVNLSVSGSIRAKLRDPVTTVGFRWPLAFTAVPIAAVHKECDLLALENEIWPADKHNPASPTRDSSSAEQPGQREFRAEISL